MERNSKGAMMRVSRMLAQAVCGLAVFVAIGCDPTPAPPPPQNTSVAGKWTVSCTQLDDDCQSFTITFASNGDITDLNGGGVSQGIGQISQGQMFFYVNDVFSFTGNLDVVGNVATGTATDLTTDENVGAKATRTT